MMTFRNILLVVLLLVLGYFSVEIRPLDEVRAATEEFDATKYAQNFVEKRLPSSFSNAIPLNDLVTELKSDKEAAFEQWSHAIAVGNIGYFLVTTSGSVSEITNDEVVLANPDGLTARLQTEFIFGNAIRDASDLVDNKEFQNTSDLNAIAAEVNNIIRQEILPPFKSKVKVGDSVTVIGAVEMNRKFPPLNDIEIQPVQLQIN